MQRIIELETYRMLALLGLPEAQRLSPSIGRIEQRLSEVTEEMQRTADLEDNHRLLDDLTALAAELEAGAAASRFASARAAPTTRSCSSDCKPSVSARSVDFPHGPRSWRGAWPPRMRTCIATEERQANLAAQARSRRQPVAHAS